MNQTEVVALVKGEERFVIAYTARHRADALRVIGKWLTTPGLNFTASDAWAMAKRIREDGTTSDGLRADLFTKGNDDAAT